MLTDTAVKRAPAKAKRYKLPDRFGLYLAVMPTGKKVWRYEYRLHGRRETLTLGAYPGVSLADARERHSAAQRQVGDGESPALEKRASHQAATTLKAHTFRALAEDWYATHSTKRSPIWRKQVRRWLDNRIYRELGDLPVVSIRKDDVLRVCESALEEGHTDTAHRCQQIMSQVFEHAAAKMNDPLANPARAVLKSLPRIERRKLTALTPKELPELMAQIENYGGRPSTRLAMRLLLLTFVRKAELTWATWEEFDLDGAEWRIPADRMKMREPHLVPLSRQAVVALRDLKPLAGSSKYVLPHISTLARPMSENTLNAALDSMGYAGKFSPHGFRRTASTLLNEQGFRPDVIERQLAHGERNKVRAAYNKATYLEERRRMMQAWANYLDGLAGGGKVIAINVRSSRGDSRRS